MNKSTFFFILLTCLFSITKSQAQQHYLIDKTFGTTCGLTTFDDVVNYSPREIFKTNENKYLIVGDLVDGAANSYNIFFMQFNPDGSIDSTFGLNGVKRWVFSQRNTVNCILKQGDKYYVCGNEAPDNGYSSIRAYVARFNSNGNPDSTFHGNGHVVELTSTNSVSSSFYTQLLAQEDGKVVAYGMETGNINGGDTKNIARRYLTDGSVDPTFHPIVVYPYPSTPLPINGYSSPGIYDTDGSIRFVYASDFSPARIVSIKLDSLGEFVPTYGTNGVLTTNIPASNVNLNRSFSGDNGTIWGYNSHTNVTSDLQIFKLDETGAPDSSYSSDGINDLIDYPGTNNDEAGHFMYQDSQNRFWCMGSGSFAFGQTKGIIYRLNDQGNYDTSFEGTGYAAFTELNGTTFRCAYFENDDELVVGTLSIGYVGITRIKLIEEILQIQNVGPDTICVGNQTLLTIIQPSECFTYQWKKDGVDIGVLNDTTLTATESGTYSLSATDAVNTLTSSSISIVVVDCQSIENPANSVDFSLFPSPAQENLSIVWAKSQQAKQAKLEIIDLSGRIVQTENLKINPNQNHQINLGNLNAGIYLIRMTSADKTSTTRFIKN
ncbi:MAG TPA: T9SS type A sorting domain-containing protein [Flavobacteriales bacterium]|nr:T9SS type A sorting domain-containing protein [Flavobacteriales bacterium]